MGSHLPDAHVHVITAGEDIAAIATEAHSKDTLHPLGVVDLLAVAPVVCKEAHRAVVAASHKFAPSGRVIHIHHRRHKVLAAPINSHSSECEQRTNNLGKQDQVQ